MLSKRINEKFLLCNHTVGVFITEGDIGVGNILGSAVFNLLFVIGLLGLGAGTVRA